ncbi:tyrosine-protein phosphatase [Zhongshania sp.]|jgi:protein-tyrosine phosphatase|uniref:tyrosine-protein phosphatase n=1 Tax=Zhongshania sp. TaxID=1971902 RepID=UPI002A83A6C9|nr:tyrosine-protein phosphatase [Zhongshania sp.]
MPAPSPDVNTRRLSLEGAPNVRDLGGYRTRDGRTTRWRKLFRGGRLSNLSDLDQRLLNDFEIKVICDFRNAHEYQLDMTKLSAQSAAVIHNLSISPGNQHDIIEISNIRASEMATWMIQINRELALNHCQTYRKMFELLLNIDDGAFMFHCSAGKDRTGFAAALILSALDVPRDVVMEDYLLTSQYYPPAGELEYLSNKYAADKPNVDPDLFATLTSTRPEFLEGAFAAIDENYDSIDEYLEQAIGLSAELRERLKRQYVE